MCKELEEELERGDNAAKALIEHLENMGAAQGEIPITTDSGCYIINIRKTL
ncbi:MAG: hypothetical protein WC356_02045 [Candidatus Micrarchaeia archaeon]|jgi:hypothetical protein